MGIVNDPTMPGWVFLAAILLFLAATAGAVVYGMGGDAVDWPDEEPTEEFEMVPTPDVRLTGMEAAVVNSGPDCLCGHPRSRHVGRTAPSQWLPPMEFFDGECQEPGCACTPIGGYLPGDGRSYQDVTPRPQDWVYPR